MVAPCLPGLEDVSAPPGPQGWEEALGRLDRRPGRRSVMKALRAIAGSRREVSPTNAGIRDKIADLGEAPPSERQVAELLRLIEVEDRLIARDVRKRTLSRRRIRFLFLAPKDADSLRPRAQTVCALGRRQSSPKDADSLHPRSTQVEPVQGPAPTLASPLNSIQNSEGREDLPLPPSGETDPDPGAGRDLLRSWAAGGDRVLAEIARRALALPETTEVAPAPASAPAPSPPPAPPALQPAPGAGPLPTREFLGRAHRFIDALGDGDALVTAGMLYSLLARQFRVPAGSRSAEIWPARIVWLAGSENGRVRLREMVRAAVGRSMPERYLSACLGNEWNLYGDGARSAHEKPTPGATRQSPPGVGNRSDTSTPSSTLHGRYPHVQ